jgi:hypothetical protein
MLGTMLEPPRSRENLAVPRRLQILCDEERRRRVAVLVDELGYTSDAARFVVGVDAGEIGVEELDPDDPPLADREHLVRVARRLQEARAGT